MKYFQNLSIKMHLHIRPVTKVICFYFIHLLHCLIGECDVCFLSLPWSFVKIENPVLHGAP